MRDLQIMAGWLWAEARLLGGFGRERHGWAALVCGLALWSLAYQAPFAYQLDIGGNQRTMRQKYDTPFLRGFNDSEPKDLSDAPEVTPYRWTKDSAEIVLPGVGGRRWRVAIRATSGRPDGSSIDARLGDGASATSVQVDGRPIVYYLAATADAAGDLRLQIDAPPLPATADKRTLGMVLYRVSIEPGAGPHLPAPGQLGLLALALALLYLLARRLACGPRGAAALALLAASAAALLLASSRMALTLATPQLVLILAGCYLLGVVGAAFYRRVLAPSTGANNRPLVVALVVLALAARLAGMLHPYAIFSDAGLNTNNLIEFGKGTVIFTEGLPSESGGGQAPYPPGQYITLAPLQLLLPPGRDALSLLGKVGNALADSMVVGMLWYLLRRSGYPERTALLGAGLYLLPGPMLKSLSVGEFANVFGQALAMPLVVYAANSARRLAKPRVAGGLALLLGLALLGHLGVTISLFGLLAYLCMAWLVRPSTRQATRTLVLVGLVVSVLVVGLYYTALADVLVGRFQAPAPPPAAALSLGQKLTNDMNLSRVLRLSPLLLALGAAGAALAAFRTRRWRYAWPRPTFGALLTAWWGGTLMSFGLLLFASQGVRWQAFFYPALCLGGGPALAQLWARGRAGRLAAIAATSYLVWNGLDFWIRQIYTYLH